MIEREERRKNVSPDAIRLKPGRFPSKLQRPEERTDTNLRLGIIKAHAEDLGQIAPEGFENDRHFWNLVMENYIGLIDGVRSRTRQTFRRSNPNKIFDFSRDMTLEIAVQQAKKLIKKDIEIFTDGLTGAWSRVALDTYLAHLINDPRNRLPEGEPNKTYVGLLFLDIDHFKEHNDSKGHAYGDKLLQNTVKTIKAHTREEFDMVGRYGGDEFAVVLPNMPSLQRLAQKGEEIRTAVKDSIGITMSVGVAVLEPADYDHTNVYRRADASVYVAKGLGRDRTVIQMGERDGTAIYADISTDTVGIKVIVGEVIVDGKETT